MHNYHKSRIIIWLLQRLRTIIVDTDHVHGGSDLGLFPVSKQTIGIWPRRGCHAICGSQIGVHSIVQCNICCKIQNNICQFQKKVEKFIDHTSNCSWQHCICSISDSDCALIKLAICIIRSEEAGELESIMLEDKKSFCLTLARIWTANGGRELDLGYATKLHSFGPTAVAASTKLF